MEKQEKYEIAKKQLCDILEKKYGRKFYEPRENLHYSLQSILNWFGEECYSENGLHSENLTFQKRMKILEIFFEKPEFFPYLNLNLNYSFVDEKLRQFSFLVSLCESDPGKLKYFYFKSDSNSIGFFTLSKIKFEYLDDERILELTNQRFYQNYETMKKFVILKDSHPFSVDNDPQNKWFKSRFLSKEPEPPMVSYQQVKYYFRKSECNFQIEFSDGELFFSKDLLSNWSRTMFSSMFMDELCNPCNQIIVQCNKSTFVLYVLFRITNFLDYSFPSNIIQMEGFPKFSKGFGKELILDNIKSIYFLCDYLDDKSAIYQLLDLFDKNVTDKYERQKLYDVLRI